jgi:hypothetical protein
LLEGVAIIAPTGNDTTGAVGTSSAAPLPYATPQAAYDDGAKILWLMPKATAYGGISSGGAAINLAIDSHPYSGGINQMGAMDSDGGAIVIQCTTGRKSLQLASVSSAGNTTGENGGAITLSSLTVLSGITASGASGAANSAGGFGNTITLFDVVSESNVYTTGGQGGDGDTSQTGGDGGQGGSVIAQDSTLYGIDCAGGAGGTGGSCDTDLEIGAGSGGQGGPAGSVDLVNCIVTIGISTDGGSGGSGGSGDAGIMLADGNGGSGGAGGTISMRRTDVLSSAVNSYGGSGGSGGGAGVGGTGGNGESGGWIKILYASYCGATVASAGGGGGSGSGGNGSDGGGETVYVYFSQVESTVTSAMTSVQAGYVNGSFTA